MRKTLCRAKWGLPGELFFLRTEMFGAGRNSGGLAWIERVTGEKSCDSPTAPFGRARATGPAESQSDGWKACPTTDVRFSGLCVEAAKPCCFADHVAVHGFHEFVASR